MCTKICTVKTDEKNVYDLEMYKKNTVRDLFTSSIIEFTWNIMTFKIQPVSKVMTDNGSNQDFVDSFEMVTFKCQTINDIYT